MVDHARFTLRPGCLAVHAGIGGAAGCETEREVVGIFTDRERSASTKLTVVPAKAGIQYAQACDSTISALGRPVKTGGDDVHLASGGDSTPRSRPVEELQRINRRRAFADLEVQLRRSHFAGLTGFGD